MALELGPPMVTAKGTKMKTVPLQLDTDAKGFLYHTSSGKEVICVEFVTDQTNTTPDVRLGANATLDEIASAICDLTCRVMTGRGM